MMTIMTHIGCGLAVLLLSMPVLLAETAVGSFTGSYDWTDKKPEEYGNKELAMTLKQEGDGWRADFTAHFFFANKKKKKGKDYGYTGLLTGDPSKSLKGQVHEAGNKKRFWNVEMKPSEDGWTGTAQETEGYKTSGTFTVSKAEASE